MKRAQTLMNVFADSGHPLGQSISMEDIPILVSQLLSRFGSTTAHLDLSPKSLDVLAKELLQHYRSMVEQKYILSDEETLQLVREIAAYVGQVLLAHAHGRLRTVGGLSGTEIIYDRPVEGVKGNEVHNYKSAVDSLGQIAAASWDAVELGIEPKLYAIYRHAVAKRVVEVLPNSPREP